jgi:hypothetical protein
MTDAAAKPLSRAQLRTELEALAKELADFRDVYRRKLRELDDATAREKATNDQFADLKERLATAEAENQRMRGYIARVQEDDVVREDLVKVGDPEGEHQLVPKRKPTTFHPPNAFAGYDGGSAASSIRGMIEGRARKPKHWVNY